jgi:hypothetical protein
MAKAHGAYIETELFESEAYKSLTKAEMRIYFNFLLKRKFGKYKGKPGKRPSKVIVNNGHITFTYAEAERLGFPRPTFQRAIDKFIGVGLIDITYQGQGGMISGDGEISGESSLYAISVRWKDYGTNRFINKTRNKDTRKGRGWSAYHERKRKEKK